MTFKEYIPPRLCSTDKIKALRKLGFKTDGYDTELEAIIRSYGYGLPGEHIEIHKGWVELEDGTEKLVDKERICYGFSIKHDKCYVHIDITYADALASEILLLRKLKLI